jgi:hypothetical protein
MTALVFGGRGQGLIGGGLMATRHGHGHGRYKLGATAGVFAPQHRHGGECLQRQGQHQEDQQEAFETGMHVVSLANRPVTSK